MFDGTFDGSFAGTFNGTFDGTLDGTFDGRFDGTFDGNFDQILEGALDATLDRMFDLIPMSSTSGFSFSFFAATIDTLPLPCVHMRRQVCKHTAGREICMHAYVRACMCA